MLWIDINIIYLLNRLSKLTEFDPLNTNMIVLNPIVLSLCFVHRSCQFYQSYVEHGFSSGLWVFGDWPREAQLHINLVVGK